MRFDECCVVGFFHLVVLWDIHAISSVQLHDLDYIVHRLHNMVLLHHRLLGYMVPVADFDKMAYMVVQNRHIVYLVFVAAIVVVLLGMVLMMDDMELVAVGMLLVAVEALSPLLAVDSTMFESQCLFGGVVLKDCLNFH